MFGVVLVMRLIPVNLLFLVGGLSLFLKNTALFQAAQTTLQPVVMRKIQHNVDYVREAISNVSRANKSGGKTRGMRFFNIKFKSMKTSAGGLDWDGSVTCCDLSALPFLTRQG